MLLEPRLETQTTLVNWGADCLKVSVQILGNEIGLDFKDT